MRTLLRPLHLRSPVLRYVSHHKINVRQANTSSLHSNTVFRRSNSMPVLGYGVYQTPYDVCESVVSHALKQGYRHVDSARAYRNEKPCADAIKASGLARSDIFFTSKVGPREMGYSKAKKAIETSFNETGLDYVDLFLIHAPYGGRTAREGTWRALVEAQQAGKIRSIGVSNYGIHHLNELKEFIETSGVGGKVDVVQYELHPFINRAEIVQWAKDNDAAVQAWSPLVRAERSTEPVLEQISKKHNKSWAQILIRWSLQKGFVPLPKSVTPARIEENANVFDFELDENDMNLLYFPDAYYPCSWDPTVMKD